MSLVKEKGRQSNLFEGTWLPRRPYAGDAFENGIYQMTRERALTKSHIQANPPALSNLLVVDVDHDDAVMRAMWDRDGWRPNWVAENPVNGHAHAIWAIGEPVVRTEYGRRKPLAYAAAVTEGLRRSVEGDVSYSGFTMKNPVHESWNTIQGTDHIYELAELEQHLADVGFMPPREWRKSKRVHISGLGRNCTLFETARTWAYREIRHHWGNPQGLADAIELAALQINVDAFDDPLPNREVVACARSISRWITTKSRLWTEGPDVYRDNFTKIQSARGRKSGAKRQAAAQEAQAALWDIVGG